MAKIFDPATAPILPHIKQIEIAIALYKQEHFNQLANKRRKVMYLKSVGNTSTEEVLITLLAKPQFSSAMNE